MLWPNHRETETITAAVPHPNDSAKSHKPQSTQSTQRPHQRIIGLSRTGLTFARPLWSLCSIWLKSVVCNPIKPIYDEYKPGSSLFCTGGLWIANYLYPFAPGWTAILTQPQRRRGTEAIFSAGPHTYNSAKSPVYLVIARCHTSPSYPRHLLSKDSLWPFLPAKPPLYP